MVIILTLNSGALVQENIYLDEWKENLGVAMIASFSKYTVIFLIMTYTL
jgi:hypothetical protein